MNTEYKNAFITFVILLSMLTACSKPLTNEKVANSIDPISQLVNQQITIANKQAEQAKSKDFSTDDLDITKKIKAKNLIGLGLKSMIINVNTTKGMVTLNGKLDTRDQVIMAGNIASEVAGVKGVKNKLFTQ